MANGGNTVPRITKAEHIGPDDTGDNIEAKRVANYIWNPAGGGSWERATASSGGGGIDPVGLKNVASTTINPATEDTLTLIKAKTDNLDVLLSTRTKPADAQHVIVDSGVISNTNLDVALSTRTKPADQQHAIVDSSALPTGASTSALQTTGNTSLGSIKTNTDNLDVALSTRLKPADTLTKVTTVDTITNVVHVDDNGGSLTIDAASLPLPTGASTSAKQLPDNHNVVVTSAPTTAITAAALPLPTGASTAALQAAGNASAASIDTKLSGTLATSSATLPQADLPSSPLNNQKTVTTAGTRVQLQTNTLKVGVIIQALSTNTGLIYVGDSAVSASNGFELQPGQATSAGVSNTNALWIDASVNGSKICFIGS